MGRYIDKLNVLADGVVGSGIMGYLLALFGAVTLTAVLRHEVPGRIDNPQCTVFGAMGLPFQDLVAAWQVLQSAQRLGLGQILS